MRKNFTNILPLTNRVSSTSFFFSIVPPKQVNNKMEKKKVDDTVSSEHVNYEINRYTRSCKIYKEDITYKKAKTSDIGERGGNGNT